MKIKQLLQQAVRDDALPPELSGCSPVFLAVLGFLTDVAVTHPVIIGLQVTSDGAVLARHEGDMGYDHALGIRYDDLLRNLDGLCDALDVSAEERRELLAGVPPPGAKY